MREWYIVYPKSKELSLVTRTFVDFAIDYESTICDRMESLLPAIKNAHKESKTSASKISNSKTKKK